LPVWGGDEAMSDIHVTPLNDLRKHLDLRQCWCRPRIECGEYGDAVVVHNSADGREHFEPDHVPESPNA
jgi:hypothetical protein